MGELALTSAFLSLARRPAGTASTVLNCDVHVRKHLLRPALAASWSEGLNGRQLELRSPKRICKSRIRSFCTICSSTIASYIVTNLPTLHSASLSPETFEQWSRQKFEPFQADHRCQKNQRFSRGNASCVAVNHSSQGSCQVLVQKRAILGRGTA